MTKAAPINDQTELLAALRGALIDYDGKATSFLGEAQAAYSGAPAYLDALIAGLQDEQAHFSSGTSWLLKSAMENAQELTSAQVVALIEAVPHLSDWAAQLHICQLIRYAEVPQSQGAQLASWLQGLLDHQRPFLRAWSLDALGALAAQWREYAEVFDEALAAANQDPAASVRARARHLSPIGSRT